MRARPPNTRAHAHMYPNDFSKRSEASSAARRRSTAVACSRRETSSARDTRNCCRATRWRMYSCITAMHPTMQTHAAVGPLRQMQARTCGATSVVANRKFKTYLSYAGQTRNEAKNCTVVISNRRAEHSSIRHVKRIPWPPKTCATRTTLRHSNAHGTAKSAAAAARAQRTAPRAQHARRAPARTECPSTTMTSTLSGGATKLPNTKGRDPYPTRSIVASGALLMRPVPA